MIISVSKNSVYTTIMSAYNKAQNGDTLWIDEGLYIEEIVMTNKYVNLVGRNKKGECHKGQVIIQAPNSKIVLSFNNIISSTIIIEGVNLKSYNTSQEMIKFNSCFYSELIFNRCIINSYSNAYIFLCYESIKQVTLKNCRLFWPKNISFSGIGTVEFVRSATATNFIITKSILSGELKDISPVLFFDSINYQELSREVLIEDTFSGTTLDTLKWTTNIAPNASVTVNDALELNNMTGSTYSGALCYSNNIFELSLDSYYYFKCKWRPHNDHCRYMWGPDISLFAPSATFNVDYGSVSSKFLKLILCITHHTTSRNYVSLTYGTDLGTTIDTLSATTIENAWNTIDMLIDFRLRQVTLWINKEVTPQCVIRMYLPTIVISELSEGFRLSFSTADYEKNNSEKFKDISLVKIKSNVNYLDRDYIINRSLESYGPKYGTKLSEVPQSYYYSGDIRDLTLASTMQDKVILDEGVKSTRIVLSSLLEGTLSNIQYNAHAVVKSDVYRTAGRYYWEIKVDTTLGYDDSGCCVGISSENVNLNIKLGTDMFGWGYELLTGKLYYKNVVQKTLIKCDVGDVLGIAYEFGSGNAWFTINGEWVNGLDPSKVACYTCKELNGLLYPTASLTSSYNLIPTVKFIFNNNDFIGVLPAGFSIYGTFVSYLVKCLCLENKSLANSGIFEQKYYLETTYNSPHLLFCFPYYKSKESLVFVIDRDKIDEDLYNFPVLIKLTQSFIFTLIKNDYTKLKIEVEDNSYKSVVIDCIDNWGQYMGLRRVQFYNKGKLVNLLSTDMTCYHTSAQGGSEGTDAFISNLSNTGEINGWFTTAAASQRLVCIFNKAAYFDSIVITNYHHFGSYTERGVKNAKIYLTETESVGNIAYGVVTGGMQLVFDGIIEQHVSSDVIHEQAIRYNLPIRLVTCYTEVEYWNLVVNTAVLHVKAPIVFSELDTYLYITASLENEDNTYIGLSGSIPAQQVWDSNYKAVYTMAQDPVAGGYCMLDSTLNAYHGRPFGSMTSANLVDGLVGKAISFDGVDDYIQLPTISVSDYTIECFMKINITAAYEGFIVIGGKGLANNQNKFSLLDGNNCIIDALPILTTNEYLCSTKNLSVCSLYQNTTQYSTGLSSTGWTTASLYAIAKGHSLLLPNMVVEHIRISNTARSPGWIKATNYSLKNALGVFIESADITKLGAKKLLIGPIKPKRCS